MASATSREEITTYGCRDRAKCVQKVVLQAHDELHRLLQQQAGIKARIGSVKQTIIGLAALFGEDLLSEDLREAVGKGSEKRKRGLTKACRLALMKADHALSVREVCDRIHKETPVLLSTHKDPLVSIATILNRLVNYGEAQRTVVSDNKHTWEWVAER